MKVELRYIPEYFMQTIDDDPRYSRIEALVDSGRCEIILTDKTMNMKAFYVDSQRRIDFLQANGADAYPATVAMTVSTAADGLSVRQIELRDAFGQEIRWQFVQGELRPQARPKVLFQSGGFGLAWIYAPHRGPGASGTKVAIGKLEHVAQQSESSDFRAYYALGATQAQFIPGTQLWAVGPSPASLMEGEQWDLTGEGGQRRTLLIQTVSDVATLIEQIDPNDPDDPKVLLTLERTSRGYLLRSVSLTTQSNTVWFFFDPGLPLAPVSSERAQGIAFSVAENEEPAVASGSLTVRQTDEGEDVVWHFATPTWASADDFETGVNVIPECCKGN